MAIFDFGNILYHRYQLENKLDSIADLYSNKEQNKLEEYLKKNHLTLDTNMEDGYTVLYLQEKVSVYTPGMNFILGSPCKIDASKVIYEGNYE